jgi:hypothetical protein
LVKIAENSDGKSDPRIKNKFTNMTFYDIVCHSVQKFWPKLHGQFVLVQKKPLFLAETWISKNRFLANVFRVGRQVREPSDDGQDEEGSRQPDGDEDDDEGQVPARVLLPEVADLAVQVLPGKADVFF